MSYVIKIRHIMERVPTDILQHLILSFDTCQDISSFVQVDKRVAQFADGNDKIWEVYVQFMYRDLRYGSDEMHDKHIFRYWYRDLDVLYRIQDNFKLAFQKLKADLSESILMINFQKVDYVADQVDEEHTFYFISPNKYLYHLREYEDDEYYDDERDVHVGYRDAKDGFEWIDNTTRFDERFNYHEHIACDTYKLLKYIQGSNQLIYKRRDYDLESLATAIARRLSYNRASLDHVFIMSLNCFRDGIAGFPDNIQREINDLYPVSKTVSTPDSEN